MTFSEFLDGIEKEESVETIKKLKEILNQFYYYKNDKEILVFNELKELKKYRKEN